MGDSVRKIIRNYKKQVFTVEVTGSTHLKLTRPDMAGFVIVSNSCSDGYAAGNRIKSDIRRMIAAKVEAEGASA